jgi:hypothetical protein
VKFFLQTKNFISSSIQVLLILKSAMARGFLVFDYKERFRGHRATQRIVAAGKDYAAHKNLRKYMQIALFS